MSPVRAVLLDCDGVILDSVQVKTAAFRALFAREPQVERIVAHHVANGGISRFEKFDYIYHHILRRPLGAEERAGLGERFAELVDEGIRRCALIAGAREFLTHCTLPKFVVSGTPQDELRAILTHHRFSEMMVEIHGSPRGKAEIIGDILGRFGWAPENVLFLGDATTDYQAAVETGVRFIAVAQGEDAAQFPQGTVIVPDLREMTAPRFSLV